MPPEIFIATALTPGLHLLPAKMDTPEARALLVAIAYQESGLNHRRQLGGGVARSYLQFERAGIKGVLKHKASSLYAKEVCRALDVPASMPGVYRAVEYQDALAVVFGRLLLWTLPQKLPAKDDVEGAWEIYIEAWRPGKPRPLTWESNHFSAWRAIEGNP
jgi:hypothetical protein